MSEKNKAQLLSSLATHINEVTVDGVQFKGNVDLANSSVKLNSANLVINGEGVTEGKVLTAGAGGAIVWTDAVPANVVTTTSGKIDAGVLPTTVVQTTEGKIDAGVLPTTVVQTVDGFIPTSVLPSYVDDVIEVANTAALPATGETGKIYVELDTGKIKRWSGSVYVEINSSVGMADTANKLASARSITSTGDVAFTVDFDGSANVSAAATLADVGTAGTYNSVTVDAKGRVTSGTSVDYQPLDASLTSLASLDTSAAGGILQIDTAGAVTVDTTEYATTADAFLIDSTSTQTVESNVAFNGNVSFSTQPTGIEFASLEDKPTTLAGYGITDGQTTMTTFKFSAGSTGNVTFTGSDLSSPAKTLLVSPDKILVTVNGVQQQDFTVVDSGNVTVNDVLSGDEVVITSFDTLNIVSVPYSAITGAPAGGTTVEDASDTTAGIVNLTGGQTLGQGNKIIDGVNIGKTSTLDMYIMPSDATCSMIIGSGAADGNVGTGAVLVGHNAKGSSGVAIGQSSGAGAAGSSTTIGVSIGRSSAAPHSSAVAVGQDANATHSNSTALGAQASTTKENQVVLGNGDVTETVINGALVVGGTSGSAGTSGQVLTSSGTGVSPTWTTISAGGTTVEDASDTTAGIVNLTGGQTLGQGNKIIDGVSIGKTSSFDMYISPNDTTCSMIIGSGAVDGNIGTGAVLIGHNASGSSGVAIGQGSGAYGPGSLTVIGVSIGRSSKSDHASAVAVGQDAQAVGENSTAIGYEASTTKADQVVLGNGDVTETVINGALVVGGTSGSAGTSGQVLTSSGTGVSPTWTTISAGGATSLDGLSDAATDSTNMLLGSNTVSGTNNTSLGVGSLSNNTTGFSNTAIGSSALFANTTGDSNTALGRLALTNITTGSNNTGIGNGADGSTATVSNEITLGNSAITSLRCQVTSITSLSDERDKTDWSYTIPGVEFLKDTAPGFFTWNTRDGAKVGIKAAGFKAQQLLAAQIKHNAEGLDLVSTNNPDKLEARYGNLIPVLVQAILDQQAQIDQLLSIVNQK